MRRDVSILLSQDEALVLFEFFVRFRDFDEFKLRYTLEYLTLSKIASQLDRALDCVGHTQ